MSPLYAKILAHRGHKIVVVTYGEEDENAAIECEDCSEVIIDEDKL